VEVAVAVELGFAVAVEVGEAVGLEAGPEVEHPQDTRSRATARLIRR
jgi:hypothetical protein